MTRHILVTGGAGFIGSHFVRHLLAGYPDYRVTTLDKLTYAGDLENLDGVLGSPRHEFVRGDVTDDALLAEVFHRGITAVVHFAAESHVDRSIHDGSPFIHTNVLGTQQLLAAACRDGGVERFIQVSTDEVYGSRTGMAACTEADPLAPNNPYAAAKAGADLLVRAYHHTCGLAAIITRCTNNYGPGQYPEKLIPLAILRALVGRSIPLYGDGLQVRDWLHVRDHCRALDQVLHRGRPGAIYNIGAGNEWTNLALVQRILDCLGLPHTAIALVADRPGHDRRYALDATRLRAELGWAPVEEMAAGLQETVEWYRRHRQRWSHLAL